MDIQNVGINMTHVISYYWARYLSYATVQEQN